MKDRSAESADDTPLFERMRPIAQAMMEAVPQARALGMEVLDIQRGKAWGKAPYRADLVGDPTTGVIAGGVITTLLDNLCGVAVVSALDRFSTTATLDLRIDYMRPAEPGRDILAMAHCYKVSRTVAFVRAVAYEHHDDDPVANATAVFMLGANRRSAKGGQ